MSNLSPHWVYIILCSNNTYYTGYTNNLEKRYKSHVTGTGRCKYTRSFKPIKLVQCWQILGDKSDALYLERYIKKLSRAQKEEIISNPNKLSDNAVPGSSQLLEPDSIV